MANKTIDVATAELINDLFCEVVIAPSFDEKSLEILKSKKNRVLLVQKPIDLPKKKFRTILNGVLAQDRDTITETAENFETVTKVAPRSEEHTSELQSRPHLVCRLLLEKKNHNTTHTPQTS